MTEHSISLAQMREAIRRVEEGGHSVFAPSSSKMWLNCAGSLVPNLLAPDSAGEDAAYGTVGHAVGEMWLRAGKAPRHLIGTTKWVESGDWGYVIPIDEVMFDHVERYIRWCKPLPGAHFVETRVDFSVLTPIPNQGGTADHVACSWQLMVITDLKMGKGVRVYAKDNTQALLYALGFFFEWDWLYDFRTIVIRIAQPRLDIFDEWTVSREFLLEFAEEVRVKAAAAWVQGAPRTPSVEACQWCRVQATCAAKAKVVLDLAAGAFDDLVAVSTDDMELVKEVLAVQDEPDVADPSTLTTLELEKLYSWRGTVERFFKKVAEELGNRAKAGTKLSLQKVVESRSHRVFKNKEAAVASLVALGLDRDDLLTEQLASPARVEELLRIEGYDRKDVPKLVEKLTFRPPGKATIVSIKDKRPALDSQFDNAFDDIDEIDNS